MWTKEKIENAVLCVTSFSEQKFLFFQKKIADFVTEMRGPHAWVLTKMQKTASAAKNGNPHQKRPFFRKKGHFQTSCTPKPGVPRLDIMSYPQKRIQV